MKEHLNIHAQALGRLAKGKPKTLTAPERLRRAKSLKIARLARWGKDKISCR